MPIQGRCYSALNLRTCSITQSLRNGGTNEVNAASFNHYDGPSLAWVLLVAASKTRTNDYR
jgi:hypothetical protein